jgi:hypothetical protein
MNQMPSRRVVIEKIDVHNNGDRSGKSELFWSFSVNGDKFIEKTRANPQKVEDGETILLGESRIVNELDGSDTLTVSGIVSERDGILAGKNETDSFNRIYSSANNWGLGSYQARLQDHPLDVTVHYRIENA